jgi:hypothetical protein
MERGSTTPRVLAAGQYTEVLEFDYLDCACPPGTEETPACNYGRSCGILKAGGKDVGDILIAEGFAVPLMRRHQVPENPETLVRSSAAWVSIIKHYRRLSSRKERQVRPIPEWPLVRRD